MALVGAAARPCRIWVMHCTCACFPGGKRAGNQVRLRHARIHSIQPPCWDYDNVNPKLGSHCLTVARPKTGICHTSKQPARFQTRKNRCWHTDAPEVLLPPCAPHARVHASDQHWDLRSILPRSHSISTNGLLILDLELTWKNKHNSPFQNDPVLSVEKFEQLYSGTQSVCCGGLSRRHQDFKFQMLP